MHLFVEKKMKIVCISDTHNKHKKILIPECDILIHAGDFSSRGYVHELKNFAQWFSKQPAKHKVFISGNHDFVCQEEPNLLAQIANDFNINYLFDSYIEIEGLKIYGSPWQPWFYNWAFNFKPNAKKEAIDKWNEIPEDTDVLITHGPPYQILDQVNRVVHEKEDPNVGCKYLLDRILKINPKLHVFGHIHEQYGVKKVGETTFVNAASCNLRYEPNQVPIIVEI